MGTLAGDGLPTGQPVLIRFDSRLSTPYFEPCGALFTPDASRQIVFSKHAPPYEAYGYYPGHPGDTPIPFWGDHYIKPHRPSGKPPTLWAWIKRTVNREIFLKSVEGKVVPGKLYWTRAKEFPKFICPQYHRHLVGAYEAVWSIVEAIRELSNDGKVLPSRWKLGHTDVSRIHERARKLSPHVNEPIYRSAQFIAQILRLEVLGLAPHYQPIREKLKSVAAEMFEILVAEFVRSHWSYEVYWSYKAPFLRGEVDVYGRSDARNRVSVVVGSCKFRTSTSPRPIGLEEVSNLAHRLGEARKHERIEAQARGMTDANVAIAAALFTNAREVSEEGAELAKEREIAILHVTLPSGWQENPTGRRGIKPKDVVALVASKDAEFPGLPGEVHGQHM